MKLGLQKKLDRFYEEVNSEESWDIGELAIDLVPDLESQIRYLEKQIAALTSDSPQPTDNTKQ